MATPAQSIINDALTALQDPSGVRWTVSEVLGYLNKAQRDIQRARPDTTSTIKAVSLRAGARQSIPVEAASLIDIPNNTNGDAITKVDKVQLDAVTRSWRTFPQSTKVVHFMHDLRTPRMFEVYPPAASGARVDMEYSAYPVDALIDGDISLGDQWANPLYHLVLHYAWAKDAEFGGNAQLSAAHLARAEQMLGVELQTTATVAPKS